MLTLNHINELDRIISEIKNIDESKVNWQKVYQSRVLYHFSEPDVCTRITLYNSGGVHIAIVHQLNNAYLTEKLSINSGGTYHPSVLNSTEYYSNGVSYMKYGDEYPRNIDKNEYFNQMILHPDIPDYNYIELAPHVDSMFIKNEIYGNLCYTISTIDLKKISFKAYF